MFLVTVPIEEFIKDDEKLVLLGEWCNVYKKFSFPDYQVMPFFWNDAQKIIDAYNYCNTIYYKFIPILREILNDVHSISKEERYYKILLGPWLFNFVQQLYDKYIHVKEACKKYRFKEFWTLSEEQYYIPENFQDYIEKIVGDRYSLQLYSQLLVNLEKNVKCRFLNNPLKNKEKIAMHTKRRLKKRAYGIVRNCFYSLLDRYYGAQTVTLVNPSLYHNRSLKLFFLMVKSRFKIIADDMALPVTIDCKPNIFLRKELSQRVNNKNEFEHLLWTLLCENIPYMYLEGFADFREAIHKASMKISRYFYTTDALYVNPVFQFYFAENYKKYAMKLIFHQHGGCYGMNFIHSHEEYEKDISDIFCNWGVNSGWNEKYKVLEKPLPHSKLELKDIRNKKKSHTKKYTVLGLTDTSRYLQRFDLYPLSSNFLYSLRNTMKFLQCVEVRDDFIIRLKPGKEMGWKIEERIKDTFGDSFRMSTRRQEKFDTLLKKTEIFISNNLNTTYLETLVRNIPTIIFIEPEFYCFRKEAEVYFDRLRETGILHFSPESAYEHFRCIKDAVEQWWDSKETKAARGDFVDKFAFHDKKWANVWQKEFLSLLQ
ncbi:MAG: LIC12162 family transferase [bacterium]